MIENENLKSFFKTDFPLNKEGLEELYTDILNKKANWLQEIPQYHIASYLGVTPETLSRIRKRISIS